MQRLLCCGAQLHFVLCMAASAFWISFLIVVILDLTNLSSCRQVASDDRAQHPITIRVPAAGAVPTPVMGNIVDTQCAANSQGKHQWFRFTAVAGHVYQINTELVAGGLLSTWLHLHVLDDDQTELLAAKAWHCPAVPGVLANGGASCVIWSCTANGDYSIRVQRYSGSGAFKVAVQDVGTVVDLATREGLRPLITDTNPNKGVYTGALQDMAHTCKCTHRISPCYRCDLLTPTCCDS
jgi:hypothetical protein